MSNITKWKGFSEAVEKELYDEALQMLQIGFNINYQIWIHVRSPSSLISPLSALGSTYDWTVLHAFAATGKEKAAEWVLLNTEIDTEMKDHYGKTAYGVAKNDAIRELLKKYGGLTLTQRRQKAGLDKKEPMSKEDREKEKREREEKERRDKMEMKRLEKERKARLEKERLEKEKGPSREPLVKKFECLTISDAEKDKLIFCTIHQGKLEDPLSLPCLHSFCRACIEKAKRHTPHQCPICHTKSDFTQPEKLSPLFFTLHFLQSTLPNAPQDPNQQMCFCEEQEASFYCTQCDERLCEGCKNRHQKSKKSSGHQIVPIDQAPLISSGPRRSFCLEHPTYEKEALCKECDEVVCSTCAVIHHSGHSVVILAEEVLTYKAEIQEGWIQGKMKEEELEKGIQETLRVQQQGQQNKSKAEQEIEQALIVILEEAQKRKQKLLEEVRKKAKDIEKAVSLKRVELEAGKAAAHSFADFAKRVSANGIELFAARKEVESRFLEAQNISTAVGFKFDPSTALVSFEDYSIFKTLEAFGSVN